MKKMIRLKHAFAYVCVQTIQCILFLGIVSCQTLSHERRYFMALGFDAATSSNQSANHAVHDVGPACNICYDVIPKDHRLIACTEGAAAESNQHLCCLICIVKLDSVKYIDKSDRDNPDALCYKCPVCRKSAKIPTISSSYPYIASFKEAIQNLDLTYLTDLEPLSASDGSKEYSPFRGAYSLCKRVLGYPVLEHMMDFMKKNELTAAHVQFLNFFLTQMEEYLDKTEWMSILNDIAKCLDGNSWNLYLKPIFMQQLASYTLDEKADLLYHAVTNKYVEAIDFFLDNCPDPKVFNHLYLDDKKSTLLHLAIAHTSQEILEKLLKKCDANALNRSEESPLVYASTIGNEAIFNCLLEWPTVELITKNNDVGNTVVHILAADKKNHMLKLLLASKKTELTKALNATNESGYTPLHSAVINDNMKGVSLLLEEDINPNLVCFSLDTPLHIAIKYELYSIANLLLDSKKVNKSLHIENEEGETPLALLKNKLDLPMDIGHEEWQALLALLKNELDELATQEKDPLNKRKDLLALLLRINTLSEE